MIVRIYHDVDMRMGVDGLREFLKNKRVATSQMKDVDFVLFMNRRKTHFKMLSQAGYVIHFKGAKYLTLEDIERVPQLFGSDKSLLRGKNLDMVEKLITREIKEFAGDDAEVKVS